MEHDASQVLDGRYRVGARIGIGGMGEVRRGVDLRLGRDVAIKFLRSDIAEQTAVRSRFEHEATSAARLSHPSAVTVFDTGESNGVPYLVMECLPGHTLADALLEGPLPEQRVRQLAVDLLGALHAAHSIGIVHRDVKPSNVLFTDDGRVKLADFGIAKSADLLDQTMTGQLVGTPAYLAPERLRGDEASPASDIYSVGVVLYEALTGRKPFQGDTPIAVAYAIANSTPSPIREHVTDVDPRLARVIHRALAKNPSERFATAAALAAAISGHGPQSAAGDATAVATTAADTDAFPITATRTVSADSRTKPQTRSLARPTSYRGYAVAGAAALLLVIVGVLLNGRDASDDQPTGTTPTTSPTPSTLAPPAPLDDAIRQLERAVRR